jgi:hypothetical protein
MNTKNAEYFPALTADDEYLYFTKRDYITGHPQEDIWYSRTDKKGGWLPAQRVSENVNSEDYNEGAHTISPTGKYWVKIRFMGKERLVEIDDRIPCSNSG